MKEKHLHKTFHSYLRSSTSIIDKKNSVDWEKAFKSLSNLRNNKNTIILSVDKENNVVILKTVAYTEVNKMIDNVRSVCIQTV